MEKDKIISLDLYKKKKERKRINNSINRDEEERIKTLDLFMKVIATMYKESCK